MQIIVCMSCIKHEFYINISRCIDVLFNTSIQVLTLSPAQTWEECTGYFRVDEERGLSPSQVEEHKKKYGPNGEFQLIRCWSQWRVSPIN